VLIRVLTGTIRPCFSRRPDEPSTTLHHHLANRDHWHHKEIGVDRGPAIIALDFTRIATTAHRQQRRFLTDRGRAPRLAKGLTSLSVGVRRCGIWCMATVALTGGAHLGGTPGVRIDGPDLDRFGVSARWARVGRSEAWAVSLWSTGGRQTSSSGAAAEYFVAKAATGCAGAVSWVDCGGVWRDPDDRGDTPTS
jgi:hypothetical protein